MKTNKIIFIVAAVILISPMFGMLFPPLGRYPLLIEKRDLAPLPDVRTTPIVEIPKKFEAYFDDHFGFRNFFISMDNWFKRKVFGIKSKKIKAIYGQSGWLFYTGNHIIEANRGLRPLSEEDLQQWASVLVKKRDFLAVQGIDYLFVVPPNKASMYPEFLPSWMTKVKPETPLDQLVAYLRVHTDVKILDLRKALEAEKKTANRGFLYYPTDTHWNRYGAYIGYRAIADRIQGRLNIRLLGPESVFFKEDVRGGGDLAVMLGEEKEVQDKVPGVYPRNSTAQSVYDIDEKGKPRDLVMENPGNDLPRLLMFRDSFTEALIPFLAESFSYSRYYWTQWNDNVDIEALLKESRPDIVIEEWVERFVGKMDFVNFQNH